MKIKQKISVLFSLGIMFLTCCGMLLINTNIAFAETSSINIESYTDNDDFIFNNAAENIKDYIGNLSDPYNLTKNEVEGLYASTIKDSDFGIKCSGDDPIVKLLPKDLFKKPNKQLTHIGKEYGFFIKTEQFEDFILSNVIVFDIINDINLTKNKDHAKFKLEVLFQREYLYVPKAGDYISKTRRFMPIKKDDKFVYYSLTEKFDADYVFHTLKSDVVMPLPYLLDEMTMTICDSKRYYVQDIVSTAAVFNEQHLNQTDEDYNVFLDKGRFITQIDGAYQATIYDVNEKNFFEELFKTKLTATIDDALKNGIKALGFGDLWDLAENVLGLYDLYLDTTDKLVQEDRKFTYIADYTTNQEQIENIGYLNRFGLSTLEFFNDGKYGDGSFMFYGVGDYYEADYQMSYTSVLNEHGDGFATPWETRVVRGFSLKFVNQNNQNDYVEASGFSDILLEDKNKELLDINYEDNTQKVSLLSNGQNLFLFNAMHTGRYTLTTNGANAPVRISIDKTLGDNSAISEELKEVNNNDRTLEIEIEAGCTYVFKVEYLDKSHYGNFDITLEFAPQEIFWGENSVLIDDLHEYYKIYSDTNSYLELKLSNDKLRYILYDKNLKRVSNNVLNKDSYYYIRVVRDSNIPTDVCMIAKNYMSILFENIENVENLDGSIYKYCLNELDSLPIPIRKGYLFKGWWTNNFEFGKLVNDDNIKGLNVRDLSLYAKWEVIEYNVQYVTNGGSNIEDEKYIVEHKYDLSLDTFRDGYVLYGWFDNPEFAGNKIEYLEKGSIGNRIFYAKWVQEKFQIALDINAKETDGIEATIDGSQYEVRYNQYFNLPIPSINEYDFNGWFYGDIQITDNRGVSYNKFIFEQDVELIAKWTRNTFYIRMDNNGQTLWLAKDENGYFLTEEEFGMKGTTDLCPGCYIKQQLAKEGSEHGKTLRTKLFKTGHIYITMALEPKDIVINNDFDEDLCCWKTMNFIQNNKNKIIDIYPVYELEKYNIMFDMDNTSQNIVTKNVFYGEDMTKFETPTKSGYTFLNWIVKNFANYETEFDYVAKYFPVGSLFPDRMPDLTADFENIYPPTIMLEPQYLPNEYTVSFAGENVKFSSKVVIFGSAYNTSNDNAFPIPSKTGYDFAGWYSGENGTGSKIVDEYGTINAWSIASDCTLYAHYSPIHRMIKLDFCGGYGEVNEIEVVYDQELPCLEPPIRVGYTFEGFFDSAGGVATQYYDKDMISFATGDALIDRRGATLYAHWTANRYKVTLNFQGGNGGSSEFVATYGEPLPANLTAPKRVGHNFLGYFQRTVGSGTQYYDGFMCPQINWDIPYDTTLYGHWEMIIIQFNLNYISPDYKLNQSTAQTIKGSETKSYKAPEIKGYTFVKWYVYGVRGSNRETLTKDLTTSVNVSVTVDNFKAIMSYPTRCLRAEYKENCVAEGTLITLADGSQKPVEELTGNEQLLVWNLFTGKFDVAPIIFIDNDPRQSYEVINLYFSDGTSVKVISEHAFWDFNLNKYVFLRQDAAQYIGHWFNKQINDSNGEMMWTKVQLVDVVVKDEVTRTYSPITYGHLCYYVNGMLSMPGATEGLINIFEVDSEAMKINEELLKADIDKYGLFTYEEFAEIIPLSEEIFNAFNAQYFKISIGKGLITMEEIINLYNCYSEFFD